MRTCLYVPTAVGECADCWQEAAAVLTLRNALRAGHPAAPAVSGSAAAERTYMCGCVSPPGSCRFASCAQLYCCAVLLCSPQRSCCCPCCWCACCGVQAPKGDSQTHKHLRGTRPGGVNSRRMWWDPSDTRLHRVHVARMLGRRRLQKQQRILSCCCCCAVWAPPDDARLPGKEGYGQEAAGP